MADIEDAERRLERFAPFIMKCFPETEDRNGIIESVLTEIPQMKEKMNQNKQSGFVKWLLITISVLFLFVMLVLPLLVVITQAFKSGVSAYLKAVTDKYTVRALLLTLEATLTAVVVNTIFGLFAAWTITKFKFKGKKLLTTLIDIPVTVSPVIAGLIFILLFGRQSFFISDTQSVPSSKLYLQYRVLSWQLSL